jgi:hypothetical protein
MNKINVRLPDGRIIQRNLKTQQMGNFIMNIITYKGKQYLCGEGDEYLRGYDVLDLGKCLDDETCSILNFKDITLDMKVVYLGEVWIVVELDRRVLTLEKGSQRLGIGKTMIDVHGILTKYIKSNESGE